MAIDAGLVTVDGAPAFKAATQVDPGAALDVLEPPRRYVSRGGDKLEHGLAAFEIEVAGRRCLDAGASTGGFTHCLLEHGATHVLAYDVGYGQLAHRLRVDERVTVVERTNIREVGPEDVPPPLPELVVCDVSFIALTVVLPNLIGLTAPGGELVVLVKPQFEADREDVGKGGVVRDPGVWTKVLFRVGERARELGWDVRGVTASPLLGPAGNVEFLMHLVEAGAAPGRGAPDLGAMIDPAVAAAEELD